MAKLENLFLALQRLTPDADKNHRGWDLPELDSVASFSINSEK